MTVQELIVALNAFPPNMLVRIKVEFDEIDVKADVQESYIQRVYYPGIKDDTGMVVVLSGESEEGIV